MFQNNLLTTNSFVLLCSSTTELPLKFPFTLPVHVLDALELNAGAGFLTTAHSAHSLSASSCVAEGLANKKVDAIFFFASSYLLFNAIIDSTHQLFLRHDETPTAHISDDTEVSAV